MSVVEIIKALLRKVDKLSDEIGNRGKRIQEMDKQRQVDRKQIETIKRQVRRLKEFREFKNRVKKIKGR